MKLPREHKAEGESEVDVVRRSRVWWDSRVSWSEIFVVGACGRGIEREIGLTGVGVPFASWSAMLKVVCACLWIVVVCCLKGRG